MAGEDVPVRSLLGKLVRTTLTGKKGPMMPDDLPRFPVKQWLQYLAGLDKATVLAKYRDILAFCTKHARASGEDEGAKRMLTNYAAVLLAWRCLSEFAGVDYTVGNFIPDLLAEMNTHIAETSADREPWVWIMETALSEVDAGKYTFPHAFDTVEGEHCILLRTSHIMDHIAHSNALREKWNSLPVKSDRVFKKQLWNAGVVAGDKEVERTIFTRRVAHLTPISLKRLAGYGLSVAVREEINAHA